MSNQKAYDHNEIGTAPRRALSIVPNAEAEEKLAYLLGGERLPANAWVSAGPVTCPACGGASIVWGVLDPRGIPREEIHPLVWDDEQFMADSWICESCDAGWHEDDVAEGPLNWVRPYWVINSSAS